MPVVCMHYFSEEDFYKISYSSKTIDAYEDLERAKRWGDRKVSRVWTRNFESTEDAKAFKSAKLKGLPRFQSTFLTKTDTFKAAQPPGLDDANIIYIYMAQIGDKYNCGYTTVGDPQIIFSDIIWVSKVSDEAMAKRFLSFVTKGALVRHVEHKHFKSVFESTEDMSKAAIIERFKSASFFG